MAVDFQCTPKEIGRQHVHNLQQRLIRDDCYIPGHKLEEVGIQKGKVKITGTSFLEGCQPENVINGFTRHDGSLSNSWTADFAKDPVPSIMFHYTKECQVQHIQILFDSNLRKYLKDRNDMFHRNSLRSFPYHFSDKNAWNTVSTYVIFIRGNIILLQMNLLSAMLSESRYIRPMGVNMRQFLKY